MPVGLWCAMYWQIGAILDDKPEVALEEKPLFKNVFSHLCDSYILQSDYRDTLVSQVA